MEKINQQKQQVNKKQAEAQDLQGADQMGTAHLPPAGIRQRQLQEAVENGTHNDQTSQLKSLIDKSPQVEKGAHIQGIADKSPVVQKVAAMQHSINNSPLVVNQRKRQEDLIGGGVKQPGKEKGAVLQQKTDTSSKAGSEGSVKEGTNNTGMPGHLKAGIESLSGVSLDNVKVHYNSSEPSSLQASAFAQGNDIHLAPGQERHLPHEAWHVVQQKQGRVKPTMQMKSAAINDDPKLEKEADDMGARAVNTAKREEVHQMKKDASSASSTVIQGKWNNLANDLLSHKIPEETQHKIQELALAKPLEAFMLMLSTAGGFEPELQFLYQLQKNSELVPFVNEILFNTFKDESWYTVGYVMAQIRDVLNDNEIGIGAESGESDDSDHGPEDGPGSPEEIIDWSNLTESGIQRLSKVKTPQGYPVLFQIFLNLVIFHCQKAGVPLPGDLPAKYNTWMQGGVFTRAKFKTLIGIPEQKNDSSENIIQKKRTGNTYSFNGGYTGASNSFNYDNVIYYRDSGGNIDFTKNPTTHLSKYNKAEGADIKSSDVKWKHPQDNSSQVQMSTDLKDKEKGVMPSGKEVKLATATRGQHFAIADMLYPNSRGGTWTWHHLTAKYKMVLVDMRVHAKHGHNGGVLLWNS